MRRSLKDRILFWLGILLIALALAILINLGNDLLVKTLVKYVHVQEQKDLTAWMQYRHGKAFVSLDPKTQARLLAMKPVGYDMVGVSGKGKQIGGRK